jgi:hypothetical protein
MIEASPTPAPFRDRSQGLAVFGAVLVILGLGILVLGAMTPFSAGGMSLRGLLSYNRVRSCETATWMIWLGIGSILGRRWSAALLLCLGIIHFVLGMLSLPGWFIVMFSLPKSASAASWAGAALSLLVRLGLSASLLAFYSQPDVRRTCEARDPTERWTGRCPLPVLGCCVLLTERAQDWFANFAFGRPMPLVGRLIGGPLGRELWLAMTLVTLYAGWRIYRSDRLAWSVYSAVFVFFTASSLLTVIGVFQAGGAAPQVGAQMWGEAANALLGLGYLCVARFCFTDGISP